MAAPPMPVPGMMPGQPPAPPPPGELSERTADAPMQGKPEDNRVAQGLSDDMKQAMMRVRRLYKEKWHTIRRKIIRRCLRAFEFYKGNQFIAFDPENFQWFDPVEAALEGQDAAEDVQLYKFTNNIYRMLQDGFVAALSAEVPKTEFFPQDADDPDDLETAKNASTLIEIIQRKNKIKSLQKQELAYLWMCGCYFTYTRYVVDENQWGTQKQPVIEDQQQQVMPDRYVCPQCGHDQPEDTSLASLMTMPTCEECGAELSDEDFYPGEQQSLPVVTGYQDVPAGFAQTDIYSPMNIDVAPYAKDVRRSAILDLEDEVDLAAIRASYPDAYDEVKTATVGSSIEGELERVARQHIYSALGGRNNMTGEIMPTLSRCWIQPWAFFVLDNKEEALKLQQMYPKGVLLVTVGDTFLEARPSRLADHWTWCGTVKGFDMYPPAIGDPAIEVQERLNDVANITHEHMDRNASPTVLADEDVINTKALSGKPMLPGTITGVKRPKAAMGRPLSDFIFQFKMEVDAHIYEYSDKLIYLAQLLSGVLPQVFGGAGDEHVETASGQKQQLNTALGRLGLFWDQVREEHADRSLIAIKVAVREMSGQVMDTVADDATEFANRAVNLDNMKGELFAYPETDQGFPQMFAEIRDRIMEFVGMAEKNPFVQAMLADPTNQKIVAMFTLPTNMVIPGEAMRKKVLQTINQLMKEEPVPGPNPFTGEMMLMPSRPPDNDFDDMNIIVQVVKEWAEEHYKLAAQNPIGFENVRAYFQIAQTVVQMQAAQEQAMAMAAQAEQGGGPPGKPGEKAPPPKGAPQ